ncbi:MAG: hypothetical protein Q8Q33_10230 [Chlamydiota bacterium]|nr:hypothetical protein [Chlamydiota bacterium]
MNMIQEEYEEIKKLILNMNDMVAKDGKLYIPRLVTLDMLEEFVKEE